MRDVIDCVASDWMGRMWIKTVVFQGVEAEDQRRVEGVKSKGARMT